jgi:hypothetical protein
MLGGERSCREVLGGVSGGFPVAGEESVEAVHRMGADASEMSRRQVNGFI